MLFKFQRFILIGLIFSFCAIANAQESFNFESHGRFGGEAKGLVLDDTLCYVTTEFTMYVFDISDLDSIRSIGAVNYDSATTAAVKDDSYLYVGAEKGLHVLNVSEPTAPELVTTLSTMPIVDLEKTYLDSIIIGVGKEFLYSIDISDPEHPVVIDSIGLDRIFIYDIALKDSLIYKIYWSYTLSNSYLDILILQSDGNLSVIREGIDFLSFDQIEVVDNFLLAVMFGDFAVYDISEPLDPIFRNSEAIFYARLIRYFDGTIYLADNRLYSLEISIIDDFPTIVLTDSIVGLESNTWRDYEIIDDSTLIATGDHGFNIIRIRDGEDDEFFYTFCFNPIDIRFQYGIWFYEDVKNYMFSNGKFGLCLWDIENPFIPLPVKQIFDEGILELENIEDDYFLVLFDNYTGIFSFEDIQAPILLDSLHVTNTFLSSPLSEIPSYPGLYFNKSYFIDVSEPYDLNIVRHNRMLGRHSKSIDDDIISIYDNTISCFEVSSDYSIIDSTKFHFDDYSFTSSPIIFDDYIVALNYDDDEFCFFSADSIPTFLSDTVYDNLSSFLNVAFLSDGYAIIENTLFLSGLGLAAIDLSDIPNIETTGYLSDEDLDLSEPYIFV